MAIEVTARAKVNLALHVTGRRADGYHLLDSLVGFAAFGDTVRVEPAPDLSLAIDGPFAAGLSVTDNLVLRAARALSPDRGARITLTKRLPLASGIGGGSADAAATLQALSRQWSLPLPPAETILALGADVPVCLAGVATRMQGIGETLSPAPLPQAGLLLVNPGVQVPTPQVFAALTHRQNPPLPAIPSLPDAASLAAWLATCRNDLQLPAEALAPQITTTLAALAASANCLFARMSGSGATCFGLFATEAQARTAAQALSQSHPGWWVTATRLA
jgi:4-diphosphocytidyl-2-C-methyl-D-erythritol kinase